MQELPLVALPPQQQQLSQSVGYPLLSLSRKFNGYGKNYGEFETGEYVYFQVVNFL